MTFGPRKSKGIAIFFTDTIEVETFLGTDGDGRDVFSGIVSVSGYADDKSQMVRDMNGAEVISSTVVYTYLTNAPYFTADSRVTVNGIVSRVISANSNGVASLRLPDHLSVTLG